jgi:RHS repeat-associated protein
VVWNTVLSPYGNTVENTDPDGDGQEIAFNLRFPGQYHDRETGLYYNWNRSYDPESGRYIQADPIGFQGGLNYYGYAYQSPQNNFDSDGRIVIAAPAIPAVVSALGKAGAFVASAAVAAWGASEVINNYN